MKFEYELNSCIPRGAWCAMISRGCDVVRVITGKSVCKTENWFVFGVWDGEFSSGRFDRAQFACCSGANVNNCKWGRLSENSIGR